MEAELFSLISQVGGTSGILLIGMWKMWNGTSKRIKNTETLVTSMDKRLVRIETVLEINED